MASPSSRSPLPLRYAQTKGPDVFIKREYIDRRNGGTVLLHRTDWLLFGFVLVFRQEIESK